MYSHTGQYDHTLSRKQLDRDTQSQYKEHFTTHIPLWLKLKHGNLLFYYGVDWRVQRDVKNTQLGRGIHGSVRKTQ